MSAEISGPILIGHGSAEISRYKFIILWVYGTARVAKERISSVKQISTTYVLVIWVYSRFTLSLWYASHHLTLYLTKR